MAKNGKQSKTPPKDQRTIEQTFAMKQDNKKENGKRKRANSSYEEHEPAAKKPKVNVPIEKQRGKGNNTFELLIFFFRS